MPTRATRVVVVVVLAAAAVLSPPVVAEGVPLQRAVEVAEDATTLHDHPADDAPIVLTRRTPKPPPPEQQQQQAASSSAPPEPASPSSSSSEDDDDAPRDLSRSRRDAFLATYGGDYAYPESFCAETSKNASEEKTTSTTSFEAFVNRELGPRLRGDAYLDWAASALYTDGQIDAIASDLKTTLYGNPHSLSSSATRSSEAVEAARAEILAFLGASDDEYEVIFTRSCTDSLRLVADTFPWAPTGEFRYLVQNHNSVLGIRDVARSRGAAARAVDVEDVERWLSDEKTTRRFPPTGGEEDEDAASEEEASALHLFAYPGEENFAGAMFPLRWAARIVASRSKPRHPLASWRVLVDAAKLAASHPVNLTETPADFLTLSFYKLFGAPTGVGALIVRKATADELTKCYWGGGAVALAGAGRDETDDLRVLKARVCERFEDGTVSFLGIAALRHGFAALRRVGGPAAIERHADAVADALRSALGALRHANGRPVVALYGPRDSRRGPVVNFNVLGADGASVSHIDVMDAASKAGIHVRAGAECNPGAAYDALGVPPTAVSRLAHDDDLLGCGMGPAFVTCKASDLQSSPQHRLAAHAANFGVSEVAFSSDRGTSVFCDAVATDGALDTDAAASFLFAGDKDPEVQVPLGSVRASVGYLSTFDDVLRLVDFVDATYRV
eukprot:CAMPEP_0185700436 /NCGR_PEP_ID=MMETSP1164-20130828/7493_1 /TAXON_ID=1104430 /ORGANISM="Chrysoreinhardia sp, Strain CCMP2950" /LENGTH=673 /DNA_ID=CAMNT_0028367387 /DNA_START=61 /DNA_END=2082 /DNA_ORIENTATION=+